MHLFFYGESGAGKSFCIEQALRNSGICPRGLRTYKTADAGDALLHIADVRASERLAVAAEFKKTNVIAHAEVFDAFGTAALAGLMPGDTLLLDELGRIERDATVFQRAVLDALNFPCRAIGVIKDEDIPFMRAVRTNENVKVVHFDGNRCKAMLALAQRHLMQPDFIGSDAFYIDSIAKEKQFADARVLARKRQGQTVLRTEHVCTPVLEVWENGVCVW